MRCLVRNQTTFYYALFREKVELQDVYGNGSGEYRIIYGQPVQMKANVSPAAGQTQVEQFGSAILYDRVIMSEDRDCPIDEHSVLCINCAPQYDENGNLMFDYIVQKVARSLHSVSYAVRKVNVS